MNRIALAALASFVAATLIVSVPAEARRLGGGGSLGTQRSIAPKSPATAPNASTTTPNPGASSQPVMPAQPGATLPAKPAAAPAAPASGMSRWLGPIAGIAAGLGLAALLSHFGLPEGLGTFLVIALFILAAVFLVRLLFARRTAVAATAPTGYSSDARTEPTLKRTTPDTLWQNPGKSEPVMPAIAGSATPVTQAVALPPGFDAAGFARNAKAQFVRMQAAYDSGDRAVLADVMTPEMFAEVSSELASRVTQKPTEIVSLDAEVLEVTTEGNKHWASIRYTGLVREDGDANPRPLDEVWNLTKPVDGSSGWLLAGIQQYA